MQKKLEKHINARKDADLTDLTEIPKDAVKKPSLSYVQMPVVNSKSALEAKRKEDMLIELRKNEGNFTNHKSAQERLMTREDCALRLQHNSVGSVKTRTAISQERR